MEIRVVAGQERPHGRASGQNRRRSCVRAGPKENLRVAVETPKKPKSTTVDIPPAAEALGPPHETSAVNEDEKEEPKAEPEDDKEMKGDPSESKMTPGVPSPRRGEKRTEPQQNVFAKKRVMMKSPKRPATPITPSDRVKRRLMKKTDTKGDDVLMPVEIEASDLLHTVNALLNDETGQEAKPWSDESSATTAVK